jgi:ribose transport system ATP-binding protein
MFNEWKVITTETSTFIEMNNVSKSFPGVRALSDVSISFSSKEVHVLLGENGAGKSTLIKILSGVYKKDSGSITINGKAVEFANAREAIDYGVSVIHQELSLIPDLTVAENIFLGREPITKGTGLIDKRKMNKMAGEILNSIGIKVNPKRIIRYLNTADKQMVEIARCLTMKTKILVLDEPTSSLTKKEVEKLFAMMRDLKAKGISIIFISHRLDEVFDICDRITVMRDGRVIDTLDADKTNTHEIVTLMIGRELSEMFARERVEPGKELLRVENLSYKEKFRNINFSVREGEIVGLYGLMGSGRSEIVRSIFGLDKLEQGNIYIDSNQAKIKRPSDAMEHGLGLITENRREEGLMLRQSVQFNLTVANLSSFVRNKLGFMDSKKEAAACGGNVEKLNIKTSSLKKLVQYLSGGNQQKVVIAKWLNRGPKVLMLDEPTRGVDVGAKYEIYSILSDLVKEGKGIFVISSEINEIMGLCDRILVIRKGRITKEFSYSEFKKDRLLEECMGGID